MTPALLTVLLAFGTVALLDGQGLVDAAKRAEEQRKANTTPSVTLRQPREHEDESQPPRLTSRLIGHYQGARLSIDDQIKADPPMGLRLRAANRALRAYIDLADMIEAEPSLMNILERYELTPRLYVRTEIMLRIVFDRQDLEFAQWPAPRTDRLRENAAFYRSNKRAVDAAWKACLQHEQIELKVWTWTTPPVPEQVP